MIKRSSRMLANIFAVYLLLFFSSSCFYELIFVEPSQPIIELTKFYKVYEMPLKFEKKLKNCNMEILIYSFIDDDGLFEKIYNLIYEGIEILNHYLNFGQEIYKERKAKWKIYIAIEEKIIKNYKIKGKKEVDKSFIHLHSLL